MLSAFRNQRAAVFCFALLTAMMLGQTTSTAQDREPQTPIGKMARNLNPMNWQLPKFRMPKLKMPMLKKPSFGNIMPGQDEKDRIIKRKDSLMTEVKQTAQRSWMKTKQTLNPKRLIPAAFLADENQQGGVQQASGASTGLQGLFGNVMQSREPAENEELPADSVNDFLRLHKPKR